MQSTKSITFAVSDVSPITEMRLEDIDYKRAIEQLLDGGDGWGFGGQPPQRPSQRPIEACSRYHGKLVAGCSCHPVIGGLSYAFSSHRPVTFSPDMIWLMVAQGFANYVNDNSEQLRKQFVSHDGTVEILVVNDFVKGSPENPWADALYLFSAAIRQHIGETAHDLLVPQFSTTGVHETAALEIVLMDAMQSYFTYVNGYSCGIPEITLEGETEDWEKLSDSVQSLVSYRTSSDSIEDWVGLLDPICRQFIAASKGDVDQDFWQSICRYQSWSGGEGVSGWINAFFPYVRDKKNGGTRENPWLAFHDHSLHQFLYPPMPVDRFDVEYDQYAPCKDDFPLGLACAPFRWEIRDREFPMEFLGGFVGVAQDLVSYGLRPEIGWAVRDAIVSESSSGVL